jgi:regulator of chromosome condensation
VISGSSGELGLGTAKNGIDVKRPRLNNNLDADKVGVVKVAAGGMHNLAITHDNKVLSWGVNDQGALGRDTTWDGGLRDIDAAEDSDSDEEDDNGLNPREAIPAAVDFSQTEVAEGTRFTDIAAGDSCSFVVTDDGRVYGWGTFRKADGVFGFNQKGNIVTRPVLLPTLKNITHIAAGANHVLALDTKGDVLAWGNGENSQLGRRTLVRNEEEGFIPRSVGLPKGPKNGIHHIACGQDHSFAISKNGTVYTWGINNFGETGIRQGAGESNAVVTTPTAVPSLSGKNIVSIEAGSHHSIAATAEGECLGWGRMDSAQLGFNPRDLAAKNEEAVVRDPNGSARICILPQPVPGIKGQVVQVAAAGDQNIVVNKQGKAFSWGFSANYQTGQGTTDDVMEATLMENTAIREKHIIYAQCGGQFSMLTATAHPLPNGV